MRFSSGVRMLRTNRALGIVHATLAPRVAAQQPPAGLHRACEQPVLADRVHGVLRAARGLLANGGGEGRDECRVEPDGENREPSHPAPPTAAPAEPPVPAEPVPAEP